MIEEQVKAGKKVFKTKENEPYGKWTHLLTEPVILKEVELGSLDKSPTIVVEGLYLKEQSTFISKPPTMMQNTKP